MNPLFQAKKIMGKKQQENLERSRETFNKEKLWRLASSRKKLLAAKIFEKMKY